MFRPIAVRNRLTTPYSRKVLGNLKQCRPEFVKQNRLWAKFVKMKPAQGQSLYNKTSSRPEFIYCNIKETSSRPEFVKRNQLQTRGGKNKTKNLSLDIPLNFFKKRFLHFRCTVLLSIIWQQGLQIQAPTMFLG